MTNDFEKKKVFADIFHNAMVKMGFFRKENAFYRCSKANRYVIEVMTEYWPDGSLYDVGIGFGSNYAPIKCYSTGLSLGNYIRATEYLALSDDRIRRERQRVEDEVNIGPFSKYLETVLPAFVCTYTPLLTGIASLHDYLKVEEALSEKAGLEWAGIESGAKEVTVLGYLAVGDRESALRVCRKIPVYCRNYIQYVIPVLYGADEEDRIRASGTESIEEELLRLREGEEGDIEFYNKKIDSAMALENKILSGSVEEFLALAAERDPQSIDACARFFGESLYLNS